MIKNKKIRMLLNVLVGVFFLVVVYHFYTTFSFDLEYKIESLVYEINDGYIENVSSNTDVLLFYKYFDLENCTIEVVDGNNEKITSGLVPNGSKTILYSNNGKVISSYINVIKGDYIEDGIIDNKDFQEMGKCLVNDCSFHDYQKKSVDIDLDGEFHLNDLMLLDKAITLGYTNMTFLSDNIVLQSEEQGRLALKVEPNYGVNLNMKWKSLDERIATVDDAGRVVGHIEGETKIQATSMDGKLMREATVKVDNTIQLLSYNGIAYINGDDVVVKIKLIDYSDVTCFSSNEDIATCKIDGKNLVITGKSQGNVDIKVSTSLYGKATYKLEVYSVYLNVMPKYFCTTPGNVQYITVSGFHTGNLIFDASDPEIIKDSHMQLFNGRNMLRIAIGNKQGRAILKVKEENGNTTNEVTIDVSHISIPAIGSVAKVGEDVSTSIVSDHLGTLTCKVRDSNKATCRIEGNQLIVTPLAVGNTTIDVLNQFSYNNSMYDCGSDQFMVVIQE